jgi:NTE family protein
MDYEFSRASIEERWRAGYADVMRINEHRDWLIDSSPELGVRVYDVHEPERRTGSNTEIAAAGRRHGPQRSFRARQSRRQTAAN